MHGTQQRAASGEDGVVYTWGTRCDQLVNTTIQGALTYIRIRFRGSDECQSIGGVAYTILDVDSERRKFEGRSG